MSHFYPPHPRTQVTQADSDGKTEVQSQDSMAVYHAVSQQADVRLKAQPFPLLPRSSICPYLCGPWNQAWLFYIVSLLALTLGDKFSVCNP